MNICWKRLLAGKEIYASPSECCDHLPIRLEIYRKEMNLIKQHSRQRPIVQ